LRDIHGICPVSLRKIYGERYMLSSPRKLYLIVRNIVLHLLNLIVRDTC